MLRKLRAVAIIALAWALIWLLVGVVLAILDFFGPHGDFGGTPFWFYPVVWTTWGAISGGLFALVLSFTESARTVSSVSLGRISAWGALGCITLPVIWVSFAGDVVWQAKIVILAFSAVLGAVCAAGTIAAVRRETA